MQNNKYPLVTIGIPTYNRDNMIKQALLSAVSQDYTNLEIIISDNASTDNTYQICKSFCAIYSNLKYFRHPYNVGATENFRTLVKMANGTYFMWLGDDDWIEKNYITECIKLLISNKGASVVAGQVKYYGTNDRYLYSGIIMNLPSDCKKKRVREYFLNVKHNGIFYGLMPKDLIVRCGLKNVMGGDLLLVASVLFCGKGYTLESTSIHRRRGGISSESKKLSRDISSKWLDYHFPRISVAKNLFQHIMLDDSFNVLSPPNKFLLAVQCILNAFIRKSFSVIFKKKFIEQSGVSE